LIDIRININNKEEDLKLLNDFIFGKLFAEKGCENETLYVTNTYTGNNFKTLSYEPNEMKGHHKGDKKASTDVLVMVNDGTLINLEAQQAKQEKFYKRSHFYNTKIYSILLNVGEDHENLPKTIMINIINFNLHPLDDYHTVFTLCEKNHPEYKMDDIIETHYIDLTIFRKSEIF